MSGPVGPPRVQQVRFLARLGAAMSSANYPAPLIRQMIDRGSRGYGGTFDAVVLPNHVQVLFSDGDATVVRSAGAGVDVRFDQMFLLAPLVAEVIAGRVDSADGERRLDRILATAPPYRTWISVTGYGIQSAGLALVLEPTWLNLLSAGVLGLLVGALWSAGRRSALFGQLVPVISALVVSVICIAGAQYLSLDHVGLRALIPPLAMFLPGAAITLAVIELTARDVTSGSSRMIAGFIQVTQLAFGILIASQVLHVNESQLSSAALNKLGPWAPWLGVAVYAIGVMLFMAPPIRFLPWLIGIAYCGYAAQHLGDRIFGSYASGFCGALALCVGALTAARIRSAPPVVTMILPGFWLLVPGSMGLIGITEVFGAEGDSALPATLISMVSVAFGLQAGLALWTGVRRRALSQRRGDG